MYYILSTIFGNGAYLFSISIFRNIKWQRGPNFSHLWDCKYPGHQYLMVLSHQHIQSRRHKLNKFLSHLKVPFPIKLHSKWCLVDQTILKMPVEIYQYLMVLTQLDLSQIKCEMFHISEISILIYIVSCILTLNKLNCFKDHKRHIHILNRILDLASPKLMKLTLEQHYMSVLHSQYHACWCSGDIRRINIITLVSLIVKRVWLYAVKKKIPGVLLFVAIDIVLNRCSIIRFSSISPKCSSISVCSTIWDTRVELWMSGERN